MRFPLEICPKNDTQSAAATPSEGFGLFGSRPGADEAKVPDQEVEGRPEIVGYIPDDDSDSADGIFRDGCCRPEYKAR